MVALELVEDKGMGDVRSAMAALGSPAQPQSFHFGNILALLGGGLVIAYGVLTLLGKMGKLKSLAKWM